ncbi:polyprenyl synthetase family protein [Clostridium kluyveri]|uniref:polyprenyl synthetase family protein n=1 Tax=Clostridium kluyveri TaxID=1534 RepID=UPI002247BE44|nr:polyprenyl synthetase family protein [Clostridium kluyveri]UZQ51196.1 polyprenyl synthetase family protein [Clostridium kluyveri]
MKFEEMYMPISREISSVEQELTNIYKSFRTDSLQEILNHFFKIPGKKLRPTLALLSSKIINEQLPLKTYHQLIQLSVALELIHSASLIHDDIIDDDFLRRGQKTLNKIYGRKIAVLAGDVIYSHAFSIVTNSLPKEYGREVVKLAENMCSAEILQAKNTISTKKVYLEIIRGKTALFMAICCKLGAALSGASGEAASLLENYGFNLGMAYQIVDDYIDGDQNTALNITLEDAHNFARNSLDSVKPFKNSCYKETLINLVNYIINFSHPKVSNA